MDDIARNLLRWYPRYARPLPWRKDDDPYRVWVAEVMLQQTRVETVIPYYLRWMEHFPTLQILAQAEQQQVLKLWEGLGYYTRARNLHRAARILVQEHQGEFRVRQTSLNIFPALAAARLAPSLPFLSVRTNPSWMAMSSASLPA